MDQQTRLAVELALEDRLRADLGALTVRPYSYYREVAMRRIAAKPGYVGLVLSIARAGATLVVAALFALAAAFVLLNLRGPSPATNPSPIPSLSPTPTPSPSSTATPSPAAIVTPTPAAPPVTAGAASAEQLAAALKVALESSDYASLSNLVSRAGWVAGIYQAEGTSRMSPQETIDFLRARARDGRLNATVESQPLLPHQDYQPFGDLYVRSIWRDFGGTAEQGVDLVLRNDGGRWFWSGVLFQAPR